MIQPLGDHILLLPCDVREKELGGIILPDSAKELPLDSKVVALGTGGLDENGKEVKFEVKEGEHVITAQFAGNEISYNGLTYKIVKQKEILAIIKEWYNG